VGDSSLLNTSYSFNRVPCKEGPKLRLPPSCMVAPIGNTVNKFILSSTFSSSIMSNLQEFVLPTMLSSNYMGMNIPIGFISVNSFEVRERTSSTEKNFSRNSLMSSTRSSIIYHEIMANNQLLNLLLCPMRQSRRRLYILVR